MIVKKFNMIHICICVELYCNSKNLPSSGIMNKENIISDDLFGSHFSADPQRTRIRYIFYAKVTFYDATGTEFVQPGD